MESQVFATFAKQLGINSQQVIQKAAEYMRLEEVRYGSSSLSAARPSGSCKTVMCLQLAAVTCGQSVDKAQAIRLSGMNKKMYGNALRALQRLLDLQPKTSIPDLAIQFGCPNCRGLAVQILQSYKKEHPELSESSEFCQAMLNAGAVYTAAKKMKVRVEKNKVLDASGVQRKVFDNTVAAMEKCATKILEETEKKTTKEKRTKTLIEEMELMQEDENNEAVKKQKMDERTTSQEDDYEEWRERILDEAYRKLNMKRTK